MDKTSKKERRAQREVELSGKILALPDKRYGVIYADPPWRFETWSENGMDRSAENHYPCMSLDAIANMPVPKIMARDCALFMWATVPMLVSALNVMHLWGFTYKSHAIWVKPNAITGYWFRNRHELLLVGTRGQIPAPALGTQFESVFLAPTSVHSAKPEKAAQMIEHYYPNVPKIELFRRGPARPGWSAWGNEAEDGDA